MTLNHSEHSGRRDTEIEMKSLFNYVPSDGYMLLPISHPSKDPEEAFQERSFWKRNPLTIPMIKILTFPYAVGCSKFVTLLKNDDSLLKN